ncbi:MAG: hypothetical protein ACO1RT_13345 [Planctomycetaceae bacterium]
MKTSVSEALHKADEFYMRHGPVYQAAARICKTLDEMGIPFAVAGALAVNVHGHERMTADVDLLLRPEDLKRFKDRWLGLGWTEKFPGSRGMRDAVLNVSIDILITGDYPGDGLVKPVSFPDPQGASERDANGVPVLKLEKIIELKLASGMTAPDRPRDLDDVIQLIRKNDLTRQYGESLNPYVHETWFRLWDASRRSDEY